MLFNSIDFAIFLPIVFILFWFVFKNKLKGQNLLVVVASYVFYGWWDWRFLFLILFSTLVDYLVGVQLKNEERLTRRKILLWISIIVNLGLLFFFKYYNFFLDNFVNAFSFFGVKINGSHLNIILPVGISFYTFQTMSYTIDVYKRKLEPTTDFIAFTAFVSFFPQLVAGPIERATHLLPQFYSKRKFEYEKAVDGMRQILWGLFKKVVIADNCAEIANQVFNHSEHYSGLTLLIGAIAFTFQIYGDFSGYSDIAIGTSRLFGFDLMQNFRFPYFSRDIAEFWRRWHISLSTWFRDYVYIPLGGSKGTKWEKVRNIFVIFLLSGFWHGANWTFIAWGGLNALYFLPLLLLNKNRKNIDEIAHERMLPKFKEGISILTTFGLTVIAWVFFRAENIGHATSFLISTLEGFFNVDSFKKGIEFYLTVFGVKLSLVLLFFIVIEWLGRMELYAIASTFIQSNKFIRLGFYFIIFCIIVMMRGGQQDFIYFQF